MARLYPLHTLIALICIGTGLNTKAQVIDLSNSAFTGSSLAGPANTSIVGGAASRYAYIFPQSAVSSLLHGDSIRSISLLRNGGGALYGTANMKIYIRTTVNSNYGSRSVNWVNLTGTTGMTKVYDKDPGTDFGSSDGWVRFEFSRAYVVDTILGKNLEMLVEYKQDSFQQSNIFWNFENSNSISAYGANQTKFVRTNGGTLTDTTNSSTEWHPSIRFEFPRYNFDLSVNKVYSLGKLPVPLGNPDTVKAIVQNVGKRSASFKLYLQSRGANNLMDSITYTLGVLESRLVNLPLLFPQNTGMDTLSVIAQTDPNNGNNSRSVYRLSTRYVYSYKDPTLPIVGGIGFNGSTGDFVAKFYSNTQKAINQISVSFAGSNQKFKLGIWKADGPGGKPGTNVWTSDSLQTRPNFITPVLPPVQVDGAFYVGVRQTGTVNVAFGYQPENPVRAKTFYYASPLGDTSWTDFSPDAPFKFAIEPRLQAVNDLAPVAVLVPTDTVKLINIVKMAPKARITNFGSADQLTPFNVKMNIFRYGNLEYTSTRSDTLSSGRSRTITFDSSFLPVSAGDYDVHVITRLPGDQLTDNDTLRTKFIVAVFKDVGPGTIFDPSSGYDYEQFVDTIYPTVFVQNYGLDRQGPFNVRAEIYDSAMNRIYVDTKTFTLTALNSILASFTPFPCSQKGTYYFRAFTELGIDIDKSNDTVRRTFRIIRSNDVAITGIVYPANNVSLLPPVSTRKPEAILENLGEMNQPDPFQTYCDIYYNNNLIYRDSISINSFRTIPQTLLYKNFSPTAKGYYRMLVYASLPLDQFRGNDTLVSDFAVGVPDDVEVLAFSPAAGEKLELNRPYPTSVTLRNNGYQPQNTPFALVFRVNKGTGIQYVKVKMVSLDSGETKTFAIDTSLMLNETGVYTVQVFTTLSKDFIRSNDTLNGVYNGVKANDIGVSEILFPSLNDTLLVNTQFVESIVRVVNLGDSAVNGRFRTTLRILNKANKVQLYSKSLDSAMNGSDTLNLKFPGFGVSNASVDILLIAHTSWADDQYRQNDTAKGESRFMVLYDVAAEGILLPANNAVYLKSSADLLPRIQIGNKSLKTMDNVFCELIIRRVDTVTLAETEVYRDSVFEQGLLTSEVRTPGLPRSLSVAALDKGVYKAYLSTYNALDQIPQNNQVGISFRIDEKTDVKSLLANAFRVFPVPVSKTLEIVFDSEVQLPQEVLLLDALGRVVLRQKPEAHHMWVDVSGLAAGVYTVQAGTGLIKIIVEK